MAKKEDSGMKLLKPAKSSSAYLKCGIQGFTAAGKTFTAMLIALGLHKKLKDKRPVAFIDTETGSDYIIPKFKEAGVELVVAKTRSFTEVQAIVKEAEENCSIIITDSISAIWFDYIESYKKKKNRKFIQFQDWGELKPVWRTDFTDKCYINSKIHFIICGRAGYEYDYETDEEGRKELIKTGTKMKAETEFGYEPSLLLEMERIKDLDDKGKVKRMIHRCTVLKDRFDLFNGSVFDDPDFSCFEPHIDALNLGGDHLGIDLSKDSQGAFTAPGGGSDWKYRQKMRLVHLDEIKEELLRAYPGSTQKDKAAKADMIEKVFTTRSWARLEEDPEKQYPMEELGVGVGKLHIEVDKILAERGGE
jgi:hypothetical protein